MKIMTPQERIESARLDLVLNFPFYGSIFLRLNVFEDNNCPTAWTDGVSLGYNVDFMGKLPNEQIIGVFVHECLHVILKHHLREAASIEFKANHKKFNVAADYALNPMIKRTPGMAINENWLYESKWDDELAEQIFRELTDEDVDKVAGGSGGDMPGEVLPWPGDAKDADGKAKAPTQADIDAKIQEVDQWVKAAEFKAQGVGKMDGNTGSIIKTAVESTVEWVDELQVMVEDICKNDYTWSRPNTRYIQQGVYLPSMKGNKPVDMLFFVDVSGSLSSFQLEQIAAEIQNIVSGFNVRCIVVYWSTKYQGMEVFEPSDVLEPDFKLTASGRGGTDFSDCWDWMDEHQDEMEFDAKAMVFFSDLECSDYPADDPGVPLLWGHVPNYDNSYCTSYLQYLPDYGDTVKVPVYRR